MGTDTDFIHVFRVVRTSRWDFILSHAPWELIIYRLIIEYNAIICNDRLSVDVPNGQGRHSDELVLG